MLWREAGQGGRAGREVLVMGLWLCLSGDGSPLKGDCPVSLSPQPSGAIPAAGDTCWVNGCTGVDGALPSRAALCGVVYCQFACALRCPTVWKAACTRWEALAPSCPAVSQAPTTQVVVFDKCLLNE